MLRLSRFLFINANSTVDQVDLKLPPAYWLVHVHLSYQQIEILLCLSLLVMLGYGITNFAQLNHHHQNSPKRPDFFGFSGPGSVWIRLDSVFVFFSEASFHEFLNFWWPPRRESRYGCVDLFSNWWTFGRWCGKPPQTWISKISYAPCRNLPIFTIRLSQM